VPQKRTSPIPTWTGLNTLTVCLENLQPSWWRAWVEAEPRSVGVVDNLREKSCFLKMDNGKSMYCPARALPEHARQGLRVSCWIRRSFDRIKNRLSEQAIHVRLEE
jgi:hypothetical protein